MKAKLFFLTALAVSLLSSCGMYHAQLAEIPLIKEKGELKVDGGLTLSGLIIPESMDANVGVSYGVNDWMAAQGYVSYNLERNYYLQGAVGAYKSLDKFVVEGYLGTGYGHNFIDANEPDFFTESSTTYYYTGKYNLFYGQLNAGWTDLTAVNIDLGVGIKTGVMFPDFMKYKLDNEGNKVVEQTFTTPTVLYEPQVFLRLGSKRLKFGVKAGYALFSDSDFYYTPFTVGAGMSYRF